MVEREPQSFRVIEGDGVAVELDQEPAEHVGAFLREARQNTGRSLADVAASLRIRAKFLQSIEDGRYEDLPGPTYTVGFIRSYADYLGVDTPALLAQFKIESNGIDGHPELEFPMPSTVGWFPTGKVVVSCAVLAAAVFGGWFYLQTGNPVDVSTVPPPPGFEVANQNPVGVTAAISVAAVAEPPDVASPVAAAAGALADDGSDNGVIAAEMTAGAAGQANGSERDTVSATEAAVTADDVEQADRLPVPIAALVSPESAARATELPQPVSTESISAPPPAATAAATVEPVDVAKPPASSSNEPTATSVNAIDPPPPASEPKVAERPSPAPVITKPTVQVAALPTIPGAGGANNTSDNGRTYGVINQEARVIIGAQADSWVQVMDGNQNVVLTRMLRAGDRYLVPNRNDLVMLTGNAGGLIISVDGQQVPRIGSDGAILHNVRLDVELLKAGRAVIQ